MSTEKRDEHFAAYKDWTNYAYWQSQTLMNLKPALLRQWARYVGWAALAGLGLIGGFIGMSEVTRQEWPTASRVLLYIPALAGVLAIAGTAYFFWNAAAMISETLGFDDREGRKRREGLATRIRAFHIDQQRYKQVAELSPEEWKNWALQNSELVLVGWEKDREAYKAIAQDTEYAAALHDLWPDCQPSATPLEHIWWKRTYIHNWLIAETSPADRAIRSGLTKQQIEAEIEQERLLHAKRIAVLEQELRAGRQEKPPWEN